MNYIFILLIIFIVATAVIIGIGRKILSSKKNRTVYKKLNKKVTRISPFYHTAIFGVSFLVSVFLFVSLCLIVPVQFEMPQTTAINWMTVHNYPKQQDLYYFVFGFPFVAISSILIWLLWICKKR